MATLHVLNGPLADKFFALPIAGTFVIGREEGVDLKLDIEKASRKHCAINTTTESFILTDLASKNGTYVNGKAVASQALCSGDVIRIAEMEFKFLQEEETLIDGPSVLSAEAETVCLTNVHRAIQRCDACDSDISIEMMSDGKVRRVGNAVLCASCVRRSEALNLHGIIAVEEIRRLLGYDEATDSRFDHVADTAQGRLLDAPQQDRPRREEERRRTRRQSRRKRF